MFKLILLASMILFSRNISIADEVVGFINLDEFVKGLMEMPIEEFKSKGAVTNVNHLTHWHNVLQRRAHPQYYSEWNKKLAGLPTIGFVKNENRWLLSSPSKEGVGFFKQASVEPYASMKDFFKASMKDDIDVFQLRVAATSKKDLQVWMNAAQELDPNLPEKIFQKVRLIKKVGFGRENEFQFPEEMLRGTKNNIGFGATGSRISPKIETLTDLISAYEQGPIDTFAVQFAALTNAQKLSLMRELEKSNPELYEKVAKTLRSRVKVGFESEEVLLGSEKKQNKGRKTVGYKNKPCDLKTILGTIKPQ